MALMGQEAEDDGVEPPPTPCHISAQLLRFEWLEDHADRLRIHAIDDRRPAVKIEPTPWEKRPGTQKKKTQRPVPGAAAGGEGPEEEEEEEEEEELRCFIGQEWPHLLDFIPRNFMVPMASNELPLKRP